MRGKKAKRIRKQVYGDQSIRTPVVYTIIKHQKQTFVPHPTQPNTRIRVPLIAEQLVSTGLRSEYQRAKRES